MPFAKSEFFLGVPLFFFVFFRRAMNKSEWQRKNHAGYKRNDNRKKHGRLSECVKNDILIAEKEM